MSSDPNAVCVGPQSALAGKAPSCQGCPNAALCASGGAGAPSSGPDPELEELKERLSHIKHKVLVLSGKGGVGKSTLTKELGFALGTRGFLVGLVDADICGPSLPRLTGVRNEEVHSSAAGWDAVSVEDNVSLVSMHFLLQQKDEAVIWRGPRKNGMIKHFLRSVNWGELDMLLIDTPPGTSDEHISLVTFLQQAGGATGAVVVTTPQEVAVADVRRELTFCRKTGIPVLGVVENMSGFVCPNCRKESQVFPSPFGAGAGQRLSKEFGVPFFGAIPLDPRMMSSCEKGVPLKDEAPDSAAVAAVDSVVAKLISDFSW